MLLKLDMSLFQLINMIYVKMKSTFRMFFSLGLEVTACNAV